MTDYELEQWLSVACGSASKPSPEYLVTAFPTDEIRDTYLLNASSRPEAEIRHILRTFLGQSRSLGSFDQLQVRSIEALRQQRGHSATEVGWSPQVSEYERRVIKRYSGKSNAPTWEGLTWVLDLLPHAPQKVIDIVHAFLAAHSQVLPDLRITGLTDAAELVRSRYILQGSATIDSLLELILALDSRDFEYLVSHLYAAQGYETEVTPAQKDRGKDVIARTNDEVIFIECKNWQGRVDATVVAALVGRMTIEPATRGIVVGTSGFTQGPATATELAANYPSRISLVGGVELIRNLNQHLGSEWHRRVERMIQVERGRQSARP